MLSHISTYSYDFKNYVALILNPLSANHVYIRSQKCQRLLLLVNGDCASCPQRAGRIQKEKGLKFQKAQ